MLTDAAARKAEAREKPYKLYDAGGLFLVVSASGGKLWRMKYRLGGKEKLLSFGPYPDVTISKARDARDAARGELRAGRDPAMTRRQLRADAGSAERSFEVLARAWHALQRPVWTEKHADQVMVRFEKDVFPRLGSSDVREITPPMVLDVVRRIEARPAIETGRRVRQRISAVFAHAIGAGLAAADPAAVVLGALAPLRKGRQPALVTLDQVRQVLMDAEAIPAHPVTRLALRLLALTAVRPGVVCGGRWDEAEQLDGDEPLWAIPGPRMKMKHPFLVPLSRQAVEVLHAVQELTGRGPMMFPGTRNAHKPLGENAMGYLLNRAGYHRRHVPHGWRAAFNTIMVEAFPADEKIIDLMLAHAEPNKTKAAYNLAQHLKRRRELAQLWADMLMAGMPPAAELLKSRKR